MANPQQGTIDSVSKIYQVVEKTQYAVPVLFCPYAQRVEAIANSTQKQRR
jgi:hypothetical protein